MEEDDLDQPTEELIPPSTAKSISAAAMESKQSAKDDEAKPEAIEAIEACATRQLMQETLETYYIPLEVWYTRTIVDKVHSHHLHTCYCLTCQCRPTASQNQISHNTRSSPPHPTTPSTFSRSS